MKKFTFVLAAMLAFAGVSNAAEKTETVYFGGAPSWAFTKFADINGPLPLTVTATQDWNEINLTSKASISTADYKAIKVYYSDLKQVGDNKMKLVVGVKAEGYGEKNWDLTVADYSEIDPAEDMIELELGDKYDGKAIDKLTLTLGKVGASIHVDKVAFVKLNGDEELQDMSASGDVKQVTATPYLEFTQWSMQYLCDKDCNLLTYTKSATESQKYVVEFAEPTTNSLQWLPKFATPSGETPDYSHQIPVGSTEAVIEINNDTKVGGSDDWTALNSLAIQSSCDAGVYQTVKIKSAKRIITDVTSGISRVENLQVAKDGKMFNLAGQQVGKDYKGIVIKDGKKVVVK